MPGPQLGALVDVPVVLGQQVDVVKDEAVPVGEVPDGLPEARVHQLALVEAVVVRLVDDVDPVDDLLPLQDGVQVAQQHLQVFLPLAVGDDDGDAAAGAAVRGNELAAGKDLQKMLRASSPCSQRTL